MAAAIPQRHTNLRDGSGAMRRTLHPYHIIPLRSWTLHFWIPAARIILHIDFVGVGQTT